MQVKRVLAPRVLLAVALGAALAAACVRPASVQTAAAPGDSSPALESSAALPADMPAGSPEPAALQAPASAATATSLPQPTTPVISPTPTTASPTEIFSPEVPVVSIPLEGPAAGPGVEISGMAWFSGTLILLPQFPERFEQTGGGSLFTLEKDEILDYLGGRSSDPLVPQAVPFYAPDLHQSIPGYDGFKAVAFSGERIYLTAEALPDDGFSYLVSGWYEPGLQAVYIDANRPVRIPSQSGLPGMGEEALVSFGRRLAALHEANGAAVNPSPRAFLYDQGLVLTSELTFPSIEYRLGDATSADENGRFWVVNTFSPVEKELQAVSDPLRTAYPEGRSHNASLVVERLIELQFTEQGIVPAGTAPIQLELGEDPQGRRWSALSRLDGMGFLLAAGSDAGTLLAFVPQLP